MMTGPRGYTFGFSNVQHLTDEGPKKATLAALIIEKKWPYLFLCEVMESASVTAPREVPTFGRDTQRPDLQERRGFETAVALSHNVFPGFEINVLDSYPHARYTQHNSAQQLQYAIVSFKGATLSGGLFGETPKDGLRYPYAVNLPDATVLLWHAPSGNHRFARSLIYDLAEKLQAKKLRWLLLGDLNCCPNEFGAGCGDKVCNQGRPHRYELTEPNLKGVTVHCPGVATRATGTLDFIVSNIPGVGASPAMSLDVARKIGMDHIPIEVFVPLE